MSGDDSGGYGKHEYRILPCNRSTLIGGDWDQLEATEDLAEDPNLCGGKRHKSYPGVRFLATQCSLTFKDISSLPLL